MPCLGTTETIQRVGLLDLTSITERTIPVTGNPFNINVAFPIDMDEVEAV
jgi:hypothetical protein